MFKSIHDTKALLDITVLFIDFYSGFPTYKIHLINIIFLNVKQNIGTFPLSQ